MKFLQGVILQVAHNGIQLYHAVRYRRTCCKGHTLAASDFIEILTFCKHIRGLLCIGLSNTSDVPHFCVEEHIFIEMALVYKQAVNTKLLKCDYIILAALVVQLLEFCLQGFLRFLHLLDRETLAIVLCLCFCNRKGDVLNLPLDHGFLPFRGKRNPLKLRMPDNDSIIIARGNPGTELLSVGWLEILFRCHQHIGIRIQPQEVCTPLFRQMVRHNIKILLRQTQTAAFHAGSDHLEGLASTHTMRQQRIIAIQDMRHCIFLVRHQADFRGHAHELDVTAIVFTGTNRIEPLIVDLAKFLSAV